MGQPQISLSNEAKHSQRIKICNLKSGKPEKKNLQLEMITWEILLMSPRLAASPDEVVRPVTYRKNKIDYNVKYLTHDSMFLCAFKSKSLAGYFTVCNIISTYFTLVLLRTFCRNLHRF